MYRYYRFFIVNNYGSSYVGISEMEFLDRNNIDLTDTLLPTAFTASSSFNSGYSASKIFDNIWNTNNTGWLSTSGQISNQWIVVDFGRQVEIFKISYQSDAYDSKRVGVKDYRIEGSNDNNKWDVLFNGNFEMSTDIQLINLKPYKAIFKNFTTNRSYSLSDNTLIHLPNSSNKSMILFGMEQGKEIALNVPFNKKNYVNDTPVGKVFTKGIESSNTLKMKEIKKEDYTPIFNWHSTNMTSNTTPSPLVASASSEFNTTLQAWKAFNGTTTDLNDAWITTSGVTNGWVQINYGRPMRLNTVMISPRNYTDFNLSSPKDFNILGSNNGDSFDLLKEVRGQNDWKQNVSKHFLFENEKEYTIYRVEVLNTNGTTSVAIGEILFGYKREVN